MILIILITLNDYKIPDVQSNSLIMKCSAVTFMFLVIIMVMISCRSSSQKDFLAGDSALEDLAPAAGVTNNLQASASDEPENHDQYAGEKKIIREGRMGIEVKNDINPVKKKVDSVMSYYGGYYASENLTNNNYTNSWNLKIRIPAGNFEKFVRGIEKGAYRIAYKNIDAKDVTEEFVDLQTRLENKRNYLKRYNELLNKANTIKDILEIEDKTRVIEEEIESAEGRIRYLSNRVAMSTLDLNIFSEKEFTFVPAKRDRFFERFKQSVSKGWYGLLDFILFLFRIWPLVLIVSIAYYLFRKHKSKKGAQ